MSNGSSPQASPYGSTGCSVASSRCGGLDVGRLIYRLTGARAGDRRDWPAIEAWARNVAAALITGTADGREAAAAKYRPPKPPAGW